MTDRQARAETGASRSRLNVWPARTMCLAPDCPSKKGPEIEVGRCKECGGALTVRTLQRPDVWAAVERVARELERAGTFTQGLRALLPAALPDWPPGGAAV